MGKATQFRILVGSYEHNLLCVSLILGDTPVFQPIFHFEAHSLSIKSIDIAKRYLVTGSNDEHIRIYDLQKRKELGTLLSHQGTVTSLKFSDESPSDATSSEKSGKWLLSGSDDGKIIIWRTKDWETFASLKGHQDRINDLAIHPTGRVAISVSKDQTIRLWNLMTAKKAAVLKIKGRDSLGQQPEFVTWSQSGDHFLVGFMNKIFIYETNNAKIYQKYTFKTTLMCMKIIIVKSIQYLVVGHSNGLIDMFNVETLIKTGSSDELQSAKPDISLRGHANRIKDLTFYYNPQESDVPYLISVSSDGKIVVWDLDKNDQVAVYDSGERLNCVAVCSETIEKADTMKRRLDPNDQEQDFTELEYETDGEDMKKIIKGNKKKGKKSKISITRE